MFEIHPMYTIDRITAYPHVPSYSLSPSLASVPIMDHNRFAQSSVSEALQAAINSGIAAAASGMVGPRGGYPWTKNTFTNPLERACSTPSSTIISLHNRNDGISRCVTAIHVTYINPSSIFQNFE